MTISDQLSAQLESAMEQSFVWPGEAAKKYITAISDPTLRNQLLMAMVLKGITAKEKEKACERLVQLLDITVTAFTYGDPTVVSTTQQTLAGSVLCSNTTDVSQTANPQLSKTVTDTYTWGLTESITIGGSTEYTAGLPSILGSKLTINLSITAGSNQSWTETNTETFFVSAWVNIPPHSVIEASMVVTFEDITFPWTAVCALSAAAATNPSDITNALAAAWPPGTVLDDFLPGDAASRTAEGTLTANAGMKAEVSFTPATSTD